MSVAQFKENYQLHEEDILLICFISEIYIQLIVSTSALFDGRVLNCKR